VFHKPFTKRGKRHISCFENVTKMVQTTWPCTSAPALFPCTDLIRGFRQRERERASALIDSQLLCRQPQDRRRSPSTGRSRTLCIQDCCWQGCSWQPDLGGRIPCRRGIAFPPRCPAASPPTGWLWTDHRVSARGRGGGGQPGGKGRGLTRCRWFLLRRPDGQGEARKEKVPRGAPKVTLTLRKPSNEPFSMYSMTIITGFPGEHGEGRRDDQFSGRDFVCSQII